MFGAARLAEVNGLVNRLSARARPLIISHAGVPSSCVPTNSRQAIAAALASGADGVKVDISGSSDGVFYLFHDGTEQEHLGIARNIQSMSSDEIAALSYHWKDRPGRRAGVEKLTTALSAFRGSDALFALDRSWWRWPALLRALDGLGMTPQILLKVPAWEHRALERLAAHRTPYPTLAICSTLEEVDDLPLDHAVNLVGIEVIAHDEEYPWFDRDVIAGLHARGLFVYVNSETLTTGIPLFAGHDDERAVLESPESSWGRLFELGVDAVQTELPWLLRDLRASRPCC